MTDETETAQSVTEETVTTEQEESEVAEAQEEPTVKPRAKASLLWGVVGVLAFLVLLQGYELVTGFRYPLAVKAGTAILVGAGATGLSYVAEPRLFEE